MRDFIQHHEQSLAETGFVRLLNIALLEDVHTAGDLTSLALIPETAEGAATVSARTNGILAGTVLIPSILSAVDERLSWQPILNDSVPLIPESPAGSIFGPARSLLTAERLVLNFLGRLSGIATLTKRYVEAVQGTNARIYDTRKTTPGWRLLEKYAVRCGGGFNHRTGLFDAVLIKDNHLALGRQGTAPFSPNEAVHRAKTFLQHRNGELPMIEIEVDTLEQLREVLPAGPDIVLLDNMTPPQIAEALRIRNDVMPKVQLEASGGITLTNIRSIAETGVERISVGALTHSAVSLDFGLDWEV